MAPKRSDWNLYLFWATLIVQVHYLETDLVDIILNVLVIFGRLDYSNRSKSIWKSLRRLWISWCISEFRTYLLFVNLINSNHQYFRRILFLWPVSKDISVFILILLVSSDYFDYQNVSLLVEVLMRNFQDNTIPRNGLRKLDQIMVEIKVILNIV